METVARQLGRIQMLLVGNAGLKPGATRRRREGIYQQTYDVP